LGNNNIVPYEQYVKHNVESVVPSDISSADEEMCDLHEYTVVAPNDTLNTRINTLRDQVSFYEQRAKFELTEREQKMELQMHAYITEQNLKEMAFKQEIQSIQSQLERAFKEKQEIQDSVKLLKIEFQQKETKLLNEFFNLKQLKNKLENKL
jgi:predicted  nucleic acid-binding Zn-ribbon protein